MMTAGRFFSASLTADSDVVVITGEEAHHIGRVLRKKIGTPITILNGRGLMASARIISVNPREVAAQIAQIDCVPKPNRKVELAMGCLNKEAAMADALRAATQLGVSRIIPLHTRFAASVRRDIKRTDRWNRIIRSAAKQCGQPWFPELAAIMSLEDYLGVDPESLKFVGLEPGRDVGTGGFPVGEDEGPDRIALIIGPEGGWSDKEYRLFHETGCLGIRLGTLVFTTPVAVSALLSVIQAKTGIIPVACAAIPA